jgi:hypothetical protein
MNPTSNPASAPCGDAHFSRGVAACLNRLRPRQWVPVLVAFDPQVLAGADKDARPPLSRLVELGWLGSPLRDAVSVPGLCTDLAATLEQLKSAGRKSADEFDFCVLLVDRPRIAEVVADPGWQATIRSASLGPPLDIAQGTYVAAASGIEQKSAQPAPESSAGSSTAQRVVMAVLDEGIAFAQARLRSTGGTRVAYLWRQDGTVGSSPGLALPGTELTAADIDAALAAHTMNGRVDEDRLYESLGAIDFSKDGFKALARRRSHGTHVLDLAAGEDPQAADDSRPIVAVELPQAAVADPAATPLYSYALLGILYAMFRARAIKRTGERLPVVLNLSYGPHYGPHDGSSDFERAVDALIQIFQLTDTPLYVVLAAGNFRQMRVHADFELPAGQSRALRWRVQPEDVTPSLMDLWLPQQAGADVSVTVASPLGDTVSVSAAHPTDRIVSPRGVIFAATYAPATPLQPRASVTLVMQPTATDPPLDLTQPIAPSGIWTVTVTNRGAAPARIEAWIWRDGPIGGRKRRGRQSYLDDPDYRRFDDDGRPSDFDPSPDPSYVKRSGTLSGIATGTSTYVIGGVVRSTQMPARYSSMGPVSGGPRTMNAPNLLAPSDESPVRRGVLAAGTRSGSTVAMNGTSVAAPQAARWLAAQIAAGVPIPTPIPCPPLIAVRTAPPPPFVPPSVANDVAGDGLLLPPSNAVARR